MNTIKTIEEVDLIMQQSWDAFQEYRKIFPKKRKEFLYAIAEELENTGDELIQVCMGESRLPEVRLKGEKGRTISQLRSYADHAERGDYLEARIDTAVPDRIPAKPDIRKMNVPLGPVLVFGASNFPFAFSTAGGDTASALAAGCPVVVKAHSGHLQTSLMMAAIIQKAAEKTGMPAHVFQHVISASHEINRALVQQEHTKAVGFTGSIAAGTQLFRWGNERHQPIPVFAEMGSVNPVFLLPEKMEEAAEEIAGMYAGSITLGVGQFCTKPGLIFGVEGPAMNRFLDALASQIKTIAPAPMLNDRIASSYATQRNQVVEEAQVSVVAVSEVDAQETFGRATVATVSSKVFLANRSLQEEIFGPYALVVQCTSVEELESIARTLEGQLTCTLMATKNDLKAYPKLIENISLLCGRFLINSVPTGVEVCLSMQHGGPFPSSTDSRFTSVGADAIKRFIRPLAYQNWPQEMLPEALQNQNPWGINRFVNNVLTNTIIGS